MNRIVHIVMRHLPSCGSSHQYPVKSRRDSSALNVAEHRQSGVVAESFYHQLQQTHEPFLLSQLDIVPAKCQRQLQRWDPIFKQVQPRAK